MTNAPSNLLAARRLLLTHLDNQPGPDDLDPGEVGIVGDPNHRGGYHCGSDRVVTNDYSVVESPRDRAGLTSDAAALDVGLFAVTIGARTHNLPSLSTWLVGQCAADAPDTRDIREVIYSPDGKTVKRWDRLRKRSTGDSSHLFHTHISYFRDAIKAGRDQTPVFRRYLTTIGLIEGDDMYDKDDAAVAWATTQRTAALMAGTDARYRIPGEDADRVEKNVTAAALAGLVGKVDALTGKVAYLTAAVDQLAVVVAQMPATPTTGPVSREDLEAALRSVLGSVDNPAPAA